MSQVSVGFAEHSHSAVRQRPAPNRSVYRFFHLSYSSIETRASTKVIGTLLSGVSTFLLVGTNSRWAMIVCPSSLSSKS